LINNLKVIPSDETVGCVIELFLRKMLLHPFQHSVTGTVSCFLARANDIGRIKKPWILGN
jgi:hypothetical protein